MRIGTTSVDVGCPPRAVVHALRELAAAALRKDDIRVELRTGFEQ